MEERQQKIKNSVKNAVLLVLFVGMLALLCLTWLSDLSMDSIPADSPLMHIYERLTYGVSGFEMRTGNDPAASPTRIAVTGPDGLIGAQYQAASVGTLYAALHEPLGQAMKKEPVFSSCTEAEFAQALRGEVLYFGYEGYLPLALLSGWMGQPVRGMQSTDLLLLTGTGELFIHTPTGYQRAQTDVDSGVWWKKLDGLAASPGSFASQREGEMFDRVRPDTLILENESSSMEQLAVRTPGFLDAQSGSDLTALLDAFSYDPSVNGYSEDRERAYMYVENYSTLRVSADGEVEFRASALEGGLEVYTAGETARDETLRLQADFACTLVRAVQGSVSDNSQAMLFDMTEGENGVCVMTFIQSVGGVPIEPEEGKPFARLEFRDNQLIAAQFHLRAYEPGEERSPLLPSIQAVAAAPEENLRPMLAYISTGEGRLAAQRCYKR